MSEKRRYTVAGEGDEERVWEVKTLGGGRYQIWSPEGKTLEVDALSLGTGSPGAALLHLLIEGRSVDVDVSIEDTTFGVHAGGEDFEIEVLNERQRRMRIAGVGRGGGESPELHSPMAGKVVQVIAEVGQVVELGDSLIVVEAMKMENDLKAHRAGVVAQVPVESGQAVEVGDVLVVIEEGQ